MAEPVGVVVVGHGLSASALVAAASGVVGADGLVGVVAVDAGAGQTTELDARMFAAVKAADAGSGVLLVADVFGSSPCTCGIRQAMGHRLAVLAGLNLAMLLKLATLDRTALTPTELAQACAESARRAVAVLHASPGMEPPARLSSGPAAPETPAEAARETSNDLSQGTPLTREEPG
jgi:PTS system mannose-specific IIA component